MIRSILILFFVTLISSGFVSAQLTMKKHDEGIRIVDGNTDVLLFHTKPSSIEGDYERCNYIHPLYGFPSSMPSYM